ncbi:unnamed protein product [Pleuronectes platessa]|uniref:Uncharacterized protein n=1 Tax=Pleuronectes platessa TaxID=8262 RepID=A0A9N7THS3_PLEPL|nr:unnamed protein product [Pleuronectes platessa]
MQHSQCELTVRCDVEPTGGLDHRHPRTLQEAICITSPEQPDRTTSRLHENQRLA